MENTSKYEQNQQMGTQKKLIKARSWIESYISDQLAKGNISFHVGMMKNGIVLEIM